MSRLSGTGVRGLREEKDKWVNVAGIERASSDLIFFLSSQSENAHSRLGRRGKTKLPDIGGQCGDPRERVRKEGSPWGRTECWLDGPERREKAERGSGRT